MHISHFHYVRPYVVGTRYCVFPWIPFHFNLTSLAVLQLLLCVVYIWILNGLRCDVIKWKESLLFCFFLFTSQLFWLVLGLKKYSNHFSCLCDQCLAEFQILTVFHWVLSVWNAENVHTCGLACSQATTLTKLITSIVCDGDPNMARIAYSRPKKKPG